MEKEHRFSWFPRLNKEAFWTRLLEVDGGSSVFGIRAYVLDCGAHSMKTE